MTNADHDFDTWFDILKLNVLEQTGVEFRDSDSVRFDYESGADVYDVIGDIVREYN